jgi:DNA-binding winged helix-turn-helix (wHTH) protein/tetratricopeptide (TPR) repeat protein
MKYDFGEFRLDAEKHELLKGDTPIAVEPRTFAVLKTLVQGHDTVLSKEDLITAAWQGRFTSDEAIASRIKDARKALGDDGRTQKYIKTIHGVGYRFVIDVCVQGRPGDGENDAVPLRYDTRPVIVVSPFVDAGGSDPVLAPGLTHDVIVGLSRLRWLKVISWASSMRLQPELREDLKPLTAANYSLTARLETRGSALSLAVQLTNLESDAVVWAERLRAGSRDINELRASVVEQTVSALELQISASEAAKAQYLHTDDLDAWANYHLGLMHMYRFNERDNLLATSYFEEAIRQQPDFARAHAGLSFAHFQSVFNRYAGADIEKCRIASVARAERSVELDANDPLANFVMGRSFWLNGDVAGGQSWLERTLAISSSFAHAHYAHGLGAVMLGADDRTDSGTHGDATAAIALSPLDPFMFGFFGVRALSFLRDAHYDEARFWANRAARQPHAIPAMDFIAAAANGMAGEADEARMWAQRARERSNNASSTDFFRALPFVEGPLRSGMQSAFKKAGLSSGT